MKLEKITPQKQRG